MKHPMQPLALDEHGVMRFKKNAIVDYLAANKLNDLAMMGDKFNQEDWEQLAQLVGYSLSGYGDLSYVSDDTYAAAEAMSKSQTVSSDEARIAALEETLEQARAAVREAAVALFRIHPDDLHT